MAHDDADARKKLFGMIEDIEVAMMTTLEADGSMRARPMWTQPPDENGDLWFATKVDSAKTGEIGREHEVCLSYAHPGRQDYVSVSGRADIVRDKATIEKHWKEGLRTWFPDGKDDPQLAFIKVHPHYGAYWDSPSSTMVHLFGYAKAAATGKAPKHPGDEGKVQLG